MKSRDGIEHNAQTGDGSILNEGRIREGEKADSLCVRESSTNGGMSQSL